MKGKLADTVENDFWIMFAFSFSFNSVTFHGLLRGSLFGGEG